MGSLCNKCRMCRFSICEKFNKEIYTIRDKDIVDSKYECFIGRCLRVDLKTGEYGDEVDYDAEINRLISSSV